MSIELFCNRTMGDNPTWADIESVLPELKEEAFFRLTILPEPEVGPQALEVQAENGYYMAVMSGSKGTGGTLYNPAAKGGERVEICGYDYDPMWAVQDYEHIVRMIKEFYETGNVSSEMWTIQVQESE